MSIKDMFLNNTQWLYPIQIGYKFVLFSHAGVSKTWYHNIKEEFPSVQCINDIAKLEPCEAFGFTPGSTFDIYGNTKTQPCTWIRPQALIDDMLDGIIQVVGHTPVKTGCCNVTKYIRELTPEKVEDTPDLWLCDSLDCKSYLVIEDEDFIPTILE